MSYELYPAEVTREFLTVSAEELFVHSGFDCIAGFPLPDGSLPVAASNLGMVLVAASDWDKYLSLCHSELTAQAA